MTYEFVLETLKPYGEITRKTIVSTEPNLCVPVRQKRSRAVFYRDKIPDDIFLRRIDVEVLRANAVDKVARVTTGDTTYVLRYLGPTETNER